MPLWRLREWERRKDQEIRFNIGRKHWARRLLKESGVTEPGKEIRGEFKGIEYRVWIGPKGGVRILEAWERGRIHLPHPVHRTQAQIDGLRAFEREHRLV
jgi:hypothetical protein